ncbi:MAG: peptidoglycan-binding protein [Actinomycetota bacterium]
MNLIRAGSHGEDVRDVQQRLARLGSVIDPDETDGTFGASTEARVRAFQQQRGLVADGIVGSDTWGALVEAGYAIGDRTLYLHEPFFRGDDILTLQRKLNALGFDAWKDDGIFGPHVDAAVREFQTNVGLEPDGIVGLETLEALERLRADVEAPSRARVREAESMREMTTLVGAIIAIDPGHGPGDPGASGPGGFVEHAATARLAAALARELGRRGAEPILLRDGLDDPSTGERARAANTADAAVCISLHLNDGEPAAEGATCLYFGTDVSTSPAGQRLAEHIQEELTGRMGLMDCRTHAMSLTILRETRMPAVQVEPCFITNPREEALLREDAFVGDTARAIAIGIERFLTPDESGSEEPAAER